MIARSGVDLRSYVPAIARASKALKREPDDESKRTHLDDLRRAYRAAQLEQHIQNVVSTAPPITDEQRDRLCALLQGAA